MKFLHIADLHLDRAFEGLGQVPNSLLRNLSQQNQIMLHRLVDVAIEEMVDFVLIVGDTFHQPLVTIQTQVMFMAEMRRLEAEEIPVVLSFGNHDYYLPDKYWFDFPTNVHLIRTETIQTIEIFNRKGEEIAISGFSYNNRWLNKSKLTEFPKRSSTATYHIGLYHGEQGLEREKGYAPFKLSDLLKKNYDYWALGHVHQRQVLHEAPPVIYPGSPQGHSKKEWENAGFLLVEFLGKSPRYKWLEQPFTQWKVLTHTVQKGDRKDLLIQLENELLSLEKQQEQLQLVEVVLTGKLADLEVISTNEHWEEEILRYLQGKIFPQSKEKIWPYRVKIVIEEEQGELPLGVSFSLIDQLSRSYASSEEFNHLTEELYRQPELRDLLPNDDELRAQQIESARTLLLQKLGFENEGRQ